MHRSRKVLAVVIVATALCAERGYAAPSPRPQVAASSSQSLTGRIIDRLSTGLMRAVAAKVPAQSARPGRVAVVDRKPVDQSLDRQHTPVAPFRFRLPPPSLA